LNALRHIAGILLATVGVTFVIGAVAHFLQPDPEVSTGAAFVMLCGLGLLPLGGACYLLRPSLTKATKPCPTCGSVERKLAVALRATHNPLLWLVGGWLFASLWGASRQEQVQCVQCGSLYFADTSGSRIAGVLLWIFVLMVALGIIAHQF
jgi:hypothetical protein